MSDPWGDTHVQQRTPPQAGVMMGAEWIVAIGAVCVALTAIGLLLRNVYRAWKKVDAFLEDWNGEPARPGRAEVPAMPQRVTQLETTVAAVDARLKTVETAIQSRP